MVGLFIERAVSEHLANRAVAINQFAQTVIVLIEVQPEHTTHQDGPSKAPTHTYVLHLVMC